MKFRGVFIFCLLSGLTFSCRFLEKPRAITVIWNGDKAEGIEIPKQKLDGHTGELHIRLLTPGNEVDLLGTIKEAKDEFIFMPAVPLTFGMKYSILAGDFVLGEVEVPQSTADRPYLLAIYPSADTLPENLLKIHLHFSMPMAEGRSLSYLTLLNATKDTMKGTFLDLQPELWNEEGTELTVWLDPGRIKLDLIPNKEFGNPLKEGTTYTLTVSPEWKSKDGKSLTSNFFKTFFVADRDDESPDAEHWQFSIPQADSYNEIAIHFGEMLDESLIRSTIRVVDENKRIVSGKIQLINRERGFQYFPEVPWKKGRYFLLIESRLEDLAGNNLNRLFEEDLTKPNSKKKRDIFVKEFAIQ
ncbi:MAG TPA: hypothetical protein PLR06_13770 [Cyclobacteriaceae bacterium]|nr:hypothetical protein [Cyclobacteriaceae bacterium]